MGNDFLLLHNVQRDPGEHSGSNFMGIGRVFFGRNNRGVKFTALHVVLKLRIRGEIPPLLHTVSSNGD